MDKKPNAIIASEIAGAVKTAEMVRDATDTLLAAGVPRDVVITTLARIINAVRAEYGE